MYYEEMRRLRWKNVDRIEQRTENMLYASVDGRNDTDNYAEWKSTPH